MTRLHTFLASAQDHVNDSLGRVGRIVRYFSGFSILSLLRSRDEARNRRRGPRRQAVRASYTHEKFPRGCTLRVVRAWQRYGPHCGRWLVPSRELKWELKKLYEERRVGSSWLSVGALGAQVSMSCLLWDRNHSIYSSSSRVGFITGVRPAMGPAFGSTSASVGSSRLLCVFLLFLVFKIIGSGAETCASS